MFIKYVQIKEAIFQRKLIERVNEYVRLSELIQTNPSLKPERDSRDWVGVCLKKQGNVLKGFHNAISEGFSILVLRLS